LTELIAVSYSRIKAQAKVFVWSLRTKFDQAVNPWPQFQRDGFASGRFEGINQAPVVTAGPDVVAGVNTAVPLVATASDDGLPRGNVLTTFWTKEEGPADPVFLEEFKKVQFPEPGVYRLRFTASDGALSSFDDVLFEVGGGASEASQFSIESARFAPARGETSRIHFTLGNPGPVKITLYDQLWREVKVLVDRDYPVGSFTETWSGDDAQGGPEGAGVYHVVIQSAEAEKKLKVLLLR
jgi:hypothetical protein